MTRQRDNTDSRAGGIGNIIDQTCFAEKNRHRKAHRAAKLLHRLDRLRIYELQIIDPHSGNLLQSCGALPSGYRRLALRQPPPGAPRKYRAPQSVPRRQILIARTHRQTVAPPEWSDAQQCEWKIQIPHHPSNDGELLPILFPKDGNIRASRSGTTSPPPCILHENDRAAKPRTRLARCESSSTNTERSS